MKKWWHSFTGHAAVSALLHGVVKTGWIVGMEPTIQRAVGISNYGNIAAAMGTAMLGMALLDPGINTLFVQRTAGNPGLISSVFPGFLRIRLITTCIYMLFILLLSLFSGFDIDTILMVALTGLSQVMFNTSQFLRGALSVRGRYKMESLLANADKIGLIFLSGIWLSGPFFPRTAMVYAWLMFITGLITTGITARLVYPFTGSWLRKAPVGMLSLAKRAWPFAVMIMLMGILFRFDAIWMKAITDKSGYQNGIYTSAFRFFDGYMQFCGLFMVIVMPMLAKKIAQKLPTGPFTLKLTLGMLMLGIVASSTGIYAAPWICQILYPADAEAIIPVFRWISAGFLPLGLALLFGAWLTAGGKLPSIHFCVGLSIMISLAGNIWLQPVYGAKGAAITCLAAQCMLAISQGVATWWYIKKEK